MSELFGMHFSPWTERARWALDHHQVQYRFVDYTTLLDEPLLRLRAGNPFGKISVPLLVTPHGNVNDSFEIARFSDRGSERAPLVPSKHLAEIRSWSESAERALCAARIRATRRIQESTEALADRLPDYTPRMLRKPLVPMAYIATGYILYKYRLSAAGDGDLLKSMDEFFGKAARALEGREHVLGQFSFADIVIATAIQAITPVDDKYIYLGAPSRRCMCEPELAARYSALVSWRDALYDARR